MSRDQSVLIRLSAEEKQQLEEAAVLAGYDALATYIRDRALARTENGGNATGIFAENGVLSPALFDLQRSQSHQCGVLAILLALTVRKATSGDLHAVEADLMRAQELGLSLEKLAALLTPDWQRRLTALVD